MPGTAAHRTRRWRGALFTATTLMVGALVAVMVVPEYFSDAANTSTSNIYKTGTNTANGSVAASSDAPGGAKTGTAKPGDKINWVVNYQNNTTAPANVDLKDLIAAGQTYVQGSLQVPGSRNPTGSMTSKYTTNGGATWVNGTPPANANGVGYTGSGLPWGNREYSERLAAPSGETVATIQGGDSYNAVTRNGLVYAVYHHRNPSQVYCGRENGAVCPGWSANVLTWSSTVNTPIGSGTAASMTTAWQNGTWIWGSKLFWFVGTRSGLSTACLDLAPSTPVSCGERTLVSGPIARADGGIGSSGILASDGRIYASFLLGNLGSQTLYSLCVDPATGSTCGSPVALMTGISSEDAVTAVSFGKYSFFAAKPDQNAPARIFCVANSGGSCARNFATVSKLGGALAFAPLLSTSGELTHLCTIVNSLYSHDTECWDLNGVKRSSSPYDRFSQFARDGSAGDVLVIGTKVYMPAVNSVRCVDFSNPWGSTLADCSSFRYPTNRAVYSIRPASSVAPNCLVATGDEGQITLFNAITGRACKGDTPVVTMSATPASYYCASGAAGMRGWSALTLPGLPAGAYSDALVTLRDQNNNIINGFNNRVLGAGQALSLTSIPPSVTKITASVSLRGVTDPASVVNGQISIEWDGNPTQMCFQTTVNPMTCDSAGFTLSNRANAVTVSATGNDSGAGGNWSGQASFTVQKTTGACTLVVGKTASTTRLSNPPKVGEPVTYTYTATNTSDVTLTNVDFQEPMPLYGQVWTWPGAAGVLAPGQTVTVVAYHNLTQAEIDSGHIANTVTASGKTPSGGTVNAPPKSTDTPLKSSPGLTLAKTANTSKLSNPPKVGDVIVYTFSATNTGNVTLTNVSVWDPMPMYGQVVTWPGASGKLLPGQTVTVVGNHNLTQAEIDSGHIANTVTGNGKAPDGSTVTGPPKSTDTPLKSSPALTLAKTASTSKLSNPPKVGDVMVYTYSATNTGNVTLTNVTVADAMPLYGQVWTWPGASGVLAPGQTVTVVGNHNLTQAEIDAGHIANTVTGNGKAPDGSTVTGPPKSTDTPLKSTPALTLAKTASTSKLSNPPKVGDVMVYTYSATNTGNVTITGFDFIEPMPLYGQVWSWPGVKGTLLPGQTVTVVANHNLTQAEINAGHIANTVNGSGKAPDGSTVNAPPKSTDTPLKSSPALTLAKTANTSKLTNPPKVGDVIVYTYSATNTGNVTLTNVSVWDPMPLYGQVVTWPGVSGVLAPGQTVTVVGNHNLTQAEIDAGHISNTVTGNGKAPDGSTVTGPPKSTDTPLKSTPALTLAKTASTSKLSNPPKVGDVMVYTYSATNTGNVTLTNVTVADAMPLYGQVWTWPGASGVLAPGQTVTVVGNHNLTQAEIDAGHIANTVTGNGKAPDGSTVTGPPKSTDTPLPQKPALTFTKTADSSQVSTPAKAGDKILYTLTTTNSGNVTVTAVKVTDPLPGLVLESVSWPGAAGTLLPGQKMTAVYSYRLTLADIDAGHVANTAFATGTPPGGGSVTTPPGGTDTPLPQAGSIVVTKAADASKVANPARIGDTITYTFTATNTGNVTLTKVVITDPLVGLSTLTYTWPGAPGTLLPGQTVSATATYQLAAADLLVAHVANTAIATGTPPTGPDIDSPPKSTDTPLSPGSGIELHKSADSTQVQTPARPGDVVTYLFVATNTGSTILTDVSIADPMPGLTALVYTWPGAEGTLLPGEEVRATATYLLTQADVDSGHATNTAIATATPPTGTPVESESTVDIPLQGIALITLLKQADASRIPSPANPGDVVTYTFTASNTGSVTLTGVTIADPLPNLSPLTYAWPGPAGTLQPGETVTATATYQLTQADLDDGHVVNKATATGNPPTGGSVTDESEVDVPVTGAPPIQFSDVVWRKIDATVSKNVLVGAEWTFTPVDAAGIATGAALVVTDCDEPLGTVCAGPDIEPVGGIFHLTGIAPGDYHLVETRAPVGYVLDSTPIVVTVAVAASTVTLPDVVNQQQPVPLIPLTGGMGTDTLTITGGALLAAVLGLAAWHFVRRRRMA